MSERTQTYSDINFRGLTYQRDISNDILYRMSTNPLNSQLNLPSKCD